MKRKKLLTLLLSFMMIMSMILAGCGVEEVVSSEPAIPEEPSSVEVSEEISEESSENDVEETTDFNTIKDDVFPIGEKVSMDFGQMTRLGDNELYPDMFEDWIIYFNGQTFQMPLPKDMCAEFAWDLDMNVLRIYNADYSKWMDIFFTEFSQSEKGKEYCLNYTTETFKDSIAYDGYTNIPEGEELTTLSNTEDLISNYIACNISNNYYGNILYYSVYNEKIEDSYTGIDYRIFYGETTPNDFNADFVVEMFKVVSDEDSLINNSNTSLNENGTLENGEAYGIPEKLTIPTVATLKTSNGRLDMIIPYENKEDFINFLDDLNSIIPIAETTETIQPFSGAAVADAFNTRLEISCKYEYNGVSYNLNMCLMPEGFNITIIKD